MASKPIEHICCLGSSFAAGPGIAPSIDGRAYRSGANYAHQLAKRLQCRLTDVSSSGSTTEHILRQAQHPGTKPQIESVEPSCDLVVITTAGNDIGYVGGMMKDAIQATWIGWLLLLPLRLFSWLKTENELTQKQAADLLGDVADAVHAKAPQARVLLVEYLCLLGPNDERAVRDIGLTLTQVQKHKRRADLLRHAYAEAAKVRSPWCEVVPIHDFSARHAVGGEAEEEEPWVTGFSLYDATILKKVPFHPTLAGMTAVADKIYAHVSKQ